jgi:BCD family chlorophyll transporter-like MFS transporter
MAVSSIVIGTFLRQFNGIELIQVVQGTAVATVVLNLIALWKQEKVRPMTREERAAPVPRLRDAWADLAAGGTAGRLIAVVFLGTMAFNMQDVLLEPYGGEVLGLSVSATTLLTATWATGALLAFGLAARWLARGLDTFRMAARGLLVGLAAFSAVILSAPLGSVPLFYAGAMLIGFGGGLFAVATLTAAMTLPVAGLAGRGLALGAWGAAQATAVGLATLIGGTTRDVVNHAAAAGHLGPAMEAPAVGYSVVYHTEIGLIFVTLVALAPLVRYRRPASDTATETPGIGLAEFPT